MFVCWFVIWLVGQQLVQIDASISHLYQSHYPPPLPSICDCISWWQLCHCNALDVFIITLIKNSKVACCRSTPTLCCPDIQSCVELFPEAKLGQWLIVREFGMFHSYSCPCCLAFIPPIWKPAAASGCDDKDICHVQNFSVLCHVLPSRASLVLVWSLCLQTNRGTSIENTDEIPLRILIEHLGRASW